MVPPAVSCFNISMSDALRKQLAADRAVALWRDLDPHAQRNSVFVVAERLDLVDVGLALAENDVRQVESWVADGSLRHPMPDELTIWRDQPGTMFGMLIVQPFVLVQPSQEPPKWLTDKDPEPTLEEIARYAAHRAKRP